MYSPPSKRQSVNKFERVIGEGWAREWVKKMQKQGHSLPTILYKLKLYCEQNGIDEDVRSEFAAFVMVNWVRIKPGGTGLRL